MPSKIQRAVEWFLHAIFLGVALILLGGQVEGGQPFLGSEDV